jgi:hypothetical protein
MRIEEQCITREIRHQYMICCVNILDYGPYLPRKKTMPIQLTWLLLEGLLPLFGAGIIYLVWGSIRYASAMEKAGFPYQWNEAADPLGWLYGALTIASQSAVKCFYAAGNHQVLAWLCMLGGLLCLLTLVSAMTDRGATSSWKPPSSLHALSLTYVVMILIGGVLVHSPSLQSTP